MADEMFWRLAEADDALAINALAARSIRALHTGSYDDAVITVAIEHAYGVDWQLVHDRTYFVVELDGALAGAGGWSYRETIAGAHGPEDPPGNPLHPSSHAARVRAFYVEPGLTRRGVGALLLRLSEDAAREAGFTRAELTATLPAVRFYARYGYLPTGAYVVPLPNGLSLTLESMTKRLAQPLAMDAV